MKVKQKADIERGLLDLLIKQVYEDENQQTWEELNICLSLIHIFNPLF